VFLQLRHDHWMADVLQMLGRTLTKFEWASAMYSPRLDSRVTAAYGVLIMSASHWNRGVRTCRWHG